METDTSILVSRALGGDPSSLEWVIGHFTPLLQAQVRYRVSTIDDAQVDDIVQEAWLVGLRKFANLEKRDERLTPVLVKFLSTTILNLCRRHLEKRARPTRAQPVDMSEECGPREDMDELPASATATFQRVARLESYRLVNAAIAMLHPVSREAVVLRLVEQLSNQAAAKIAGIAPNTMAVRFHRAVKELSAMVPPGILDELNV